MPFKNKLTSPIIVKAEGDPSDVHMMNVSSVGCDVTRSSRSRHGKLTDYLHLPAIFLVGNEVKPQCPVVVAPTYFACRTPLQESAARSLLALEGLG